MFGLAVEDIGDINQDSYKGNTADFVPIMFSVTNCTLINFFFVHVLAQISQLELHRMMTGQETSTFIMDLHKESKPVLHRLLMKNISLTMNVEMLTVKKETIALKTHAAVLQHTGTPNHTSYITAFVLIMM